MTPEQRHKNMSAIHGSGTKPEMLVRKFLWSRGFRYRTCDKRFPGKPDVVLSKYKTCIFVNGCFWHGHQGCKYFRQPKSNPEYWGPKIARNIERDDEVLHRIGEMGWHTIIIWECELKPSARQSTLLQLEDLLGQFFLNDHKVGKNQYKTFGDDEDCGASLPVAAEDEAVFGSSSRESLRDISPSISSE